MLQWNEMHPYNAVHVVQIGGILEPERLRSCLNSVIETRGLARLSLDPDRAIFSYSGGTANCDIRIIGDVTDPLPALVSEIGRQLNLRFDQAQPFNVFRFVAAPANDSFYLGLAYFHLVADAESVVWLLKSIVACYLRKSTEDSEWRPSLYPPNRSHLLCRQPLVVARKILALPCQIRSLRQSHRPNYRDPADMTNGFTFFSLGPAELDLLFRAAKSWAVTVNDLLLALSMKSLARFSPERSQARRRRKITVGCIVNIRKDLNIQSRKVFGLFLGSFTITHTVPVGISLRQIAEEVRQLTVPIKRHKLFLANSLELGLARSVTKFFSTARRKNLYAKHYPLWGGITNMNLNPFWESTTDDMPLDYFRGVSTGPVTPLVFSTTTFRDRLNVGISYRTTVFTEKDVQNLITRFRGGIREAQPAA